jgi:hypothetical protein
MLKPKLGQTKWNWPRGSSCPAKGDSRPSRSGPNWLDVKPSVSSRYESGETSITALKAGCATAQW